MAMTLHARRRCSTLCLLWLLSLLLLLLLLQWPLLLYAWLAGSQGNEQV